MFKIDTISIFQPADITRYGQAFFFCRDMFQPDLRQVAEDGLLYAFPQPDIPVPEDKAQEVHARVPSSVISAIFVFFFCPADRERGICYPLSLWWGGFVIFVDYSDQQRREPT